MALIYFLIGCFIFGLLLSDENIKGRKLIGIAMIASVIWPVTLAVGVGFTIGEKADKIKRSRE